MSVIFSGRRWSEAPCRKRKYDFCTPFPIKIGLRGKEKESRKAETESESSPRAKLQETVIHLLTFLYNITTLEVHTFDQIEHVLACDQMRNVA